MNGPDENTGLKTVQGGSSGRSEDANSGICQCAEVLQKEGFVKAQSWGPWTPKRPHDEECLLSTLET